MTLLDAAKTAAKWMEFWIDSEECECVGSHYCGWDDRQKELREIKAAIANATSTEGSK